MSFKGKVAVVAGAGGAVGAAVARTLRSQGALVLAVDREAHRLAPLAEEGVEVLVADLGRSEDVVAYAARAVELWGGIDLFFNAADSEGPLASLADYPEVAFDEVLDANLRPVFLGLKHVLPQMREGGAVVNLASDLALMAAPGLSGYVASKHGVLGLTRAASLECEQRGIKVNAVCPSRPAPDDHDGGEETTEDTANLVVFLLSDRGPVHHRPERVVDLSNGDGQRLDPATPGPVATEARG